MLPVKKATEYSPDSIADTASNFIVQRPGTHNSLVITKHVTDADSLITDGVLEIELSIMKEMLSYPEIDGNPLKIFKDYSTPKSGRKNF